MAHEPRDHGDLNQLHLEWRAIVLDKLNSLEVGQNSLSREIVDIKTSFAQQAELKELREKVSVLESFRFKLVGGLLTLQVITSAIIFIFSN